MDVRIGYDSLKISRLSEEETKESSTFVTNQYRACVFAHNYRYARSRARIQCMVESGVTPLENFEDIRTHDSLMHGSLVMLHNMITLKALGHT